MIQVMNKVKSEYFTNEDEKFISTFATYCALVLQYARINDAKTKGVVKLFHFIKLICMNVYK